MKWPVLILVLVVTAVGVLAQTEGARISGRVTDQSGRVIVGSKCTITNLETNVSTTSATNDDGIYVIPDLHPATYRLTVEKEGFRSVEQPSLQLYAQDAVNENFTLAIGIRSENITVLSDLGGLQTDSAAVSTMVDQQFVDNMPLNGRSFQSLITLAPGVVLTSANLGPGQFSVNGQRSNDNYFIVDGVSANFGLQIGPLDQALGGAIPGFTSQGGTNGLVSVDDMQEFRIQTSSYAAEFGRTPGGQVSIVTKSGTNQFHGTLYDYFRNEFFDARNFFDAPPLPKPPVRQNDFGGTFGGPIVKDKTFFFFSYEGLRLRLPQTATGDFFTQSARSAVAPFYQPLVNALPLPDPNAPLIDPTCDNITNPCEATITAAYSDPSDLNATSIRIDHNLTKSITLFGRYNHATSFDATRSWEDLGYSRVDLDTMTVGATITLTPNKVNDFRGNWSRNSSTYSNSLTDFNGALVPPTSVLFPALSPFNPSANSALVYFTGDMVIRQGPEYEDLNTQLNFVDTFFWAVRSHQLKFGIDYRRLSPLFREGSGYSITPTDFTLLTAGTITSVGIGMGFPFSVNVDNYSLFAQDTWKPTSRLTLTYGLRWEINTPPASATPGMPLYVVQGIFDSNPLALVPGSYWHTRFDKFAPRVGGAYQITPTTVVRAGFGLYYDLGYGGVGDASGYFPYENSKRVSFTPPAPLNWSNPVFQPLPFSTTLNQNVLYLSAVDPNLDLPLTLQWNAAIQREVGRNQTLQLTYLGSDGRDLLREDGLAPPSFVALGSGGYVFATRNAGYSHYNALQVQFQRRMSHGLQALVSYNLAKSSDLGSYDSTGVNAATVSQVVLPSLTPSDFDIRNSIAGAVSYEVPAPPWGRLGKAVLGGWAIDGLVRVSSAPPINITVEVLSPVFGYYKTQAEIVPGQPYWIPDPTQPCGRALNPAAFTLPPVGQMGDFPRNGLRSPYSINQTDLALRRRFNLTDRLTLSMRAEYFNIFNHPMFGAPGANEPGDPFQPFGQIGPGSTTNLVLGPAAAFGGQSPLYSLGGPRSAQFTVKLQF